MRIREKHVGRVSKRLFFSRDEKKKYLMVSFLRDFYSRERKSGRHTHTKVVNASSLCACTRE